MIEENNFFNYLNEDEIYVSKSKDISDIKNANLLINSDNLIALKALQGIFHNQIKCVYLDVPYNTGNEFNYGSDNVSSHQWSSFIKERLELIYQLLTQDGFLFFQIDSHELHHARIILDDVFGMENYRNSIIISKDKKNITSKYHLNIAYHTILLYSKNPKTILPQSYYDENWLDLFANGHLTDFPHELNEQVIERVLKWVTKPKDTVLDAFVGSGTTCAVAQKLGRKWIGIEKGIHCKNIALKRLKALISDDDIRQRNFFRFFTEKKEKNKMKKKLSINFIIEYFYPEIGGLEKSTERLAEELSKKKHDINIITKLSQKNTLEKEKYKGFNIFRYRGDYIQKAKNDGIFDKGDINIVFGVGHKKSENIWSAIFSSQKPTFIKIGTSGDILDKGIPKEAFDGFDAILCQNDVLCKEVEKLGIEGVSSEKIKNGLDITKWKADLVSKKIARKRLGIKENAFVVSAIARFVKRKNIPLIIEGANLYYKKYHPKDFYLLLHGGAKGQHDSDEELIFKLVKKYSSHFPIITKSPNSSVEESLCASDVFITMGEKEGAPNIIIEALATSLPIVASDISGHDVYVKKDNGFLIDFDPNSIADSLNILFTKEDLRREFSENSFLHSCEFDIQKTSDIYLDIFYKYLKGNEND